MPAQNRPSQTAITVLAGVWLTACDPPTRDQVPPELAEYAEKALKAIGSPAWVFKLGFMRWLVHRLEQTRLVPGMYAHFPARKAAIAECVQNAHPSRLVVLGAGLDGLAWLMANELEAIELDWPSSQASKKRVLAALPSRPVMLLEADLSAPGFVYPLQHGDPEHTVFVAEGLFMYLPEESVRHLLRAAKEHGRHFVFTFLTLDDQGRPGFPHIRVDVDKYLARVQEPFRWGIRPGDVAAFLESEGWRIERAFGASADIPRLEVREQMVEGEWVVYAVAD
jgi:O-methyltransferase involved in polyketide biosynthesis